MIFEQILIADFIGFFLVLAGFIIGLGAVTVIDLHGFLGRKSSYWTEATTRTHKVTKPLIWIGTFLLLIGGMFLYGNEVLSGIPLIHLILLIALILNGIFLSFSVSPYLLKREIEGREKELLPKKWQMKITFSFIISFVGWWGSVFLFTVYILSNT